MTTSVVVLTGAGISAESGIKTFRAADGLWENHRVEDVATPEGFLQNPALVHRFYNERRQQLLLPTVQPNAAHFALAIFEQENQGDFLLVTQNIDDLHERAGTKNLIHMHGELLKLRCERCQTIVAWLTTADETTQCAHCQHIGAMRPHIVWFGEMPFAMETIFAALIHCSLFVSIGTSGNVYPAAGFVQIARESGAHTVELNLEPSQLRSQFDEQHYGPASRIVPDYLSKLVSQANPL